MGGYLKAATVAEALDQLSTLSNLELTNARLMPLSPEEFDSCHPTAQHRRHRRYGTCKDTKEC
eukprot:2247662-Pleurochrysis_carterae.AAC.1